MVFRSITKTVVIEARPQKVFSFLVDASNWHLWAIVNVLSVSTGDGRWWHMKTPAGTARLRIRPNAELGTLDHDFHAPDAQWTVPARGVPNGTGSLFMITFFQPHAFSDRLFDEQVALVDRELAKRKELMECL